MLKLPTNLGPDDLPYKQTPRIILKEGLTRSAAILVGGLVPCLIFLIIIAAWKIIGPAILVTVIIVVLGVISCFVLLSIFVSSRSSSHPVNYSLPEMGSTHIVSNYNYSKVETDKTSDLAMDLKAAYTLFTHNPFEFERWVIALVRGVPGQRGVGDGGQDGTVHYDKGAGTTPGKIAVTVKGGRLLNSAMLRDLSSIVSHDPTLDGGILVTLSEPTLAMTAAAANAGSYKDWNGKLYPLLQIVTVKDLLSGEYPQTPTIILPHTQARPIVDIVKQMNLLD